MHINRFTGSRTAVSFYNTLIITSKLCVRNTGTEDMKLFQNIFWLYVWYIATNLHNVYIQK